MALTKGGREKRGWDIVLHTTTIKPTMALPKGGREKRGWDIILQTTPALLWKRRGEGKNSQIVE